MEQDIKQEIRKTGQHPEQRKNLNRFPAFLLSLFEFCWLPGLKLSRYPRFFAATLAALPSISEIPLLDS
jgi:hypothetical protein